MPNWLEVGTSPMLFVGCCSLTYLSTESAYITGAAACGLLLSCGLSIQDLINWEKCSKYAVTV